MTEQLNTEAKTDAGEPLVGAATTGKKRDYEIGRGRPPEQYKWKKGQSGNPNGRPRKKPSEKAILEKITHEAIGIREDGKPRKVTKFEAMLRSHMAKAIKGDVRSAKLILEESARVGLGQEQDSGASALLPPNSQTVQSDVLFANLNLDLLSEGDKIELARLGQVIDLGGDFTALSPRDFERVKQIAEKGRGKDVTLNG
jgi:hypothetical protein